MALFSAQLAPRAVGLDLVAVGRVQFGVGGQPALNLDLSVHVSETAGIGVQEMYSFLGCISVDATLRADKRNNGQVVGPCYVILYQAWCYHAVTDAQMRMRTVKSISKDNNVCNSFALYPKEKPKGNQAKFWSSRPIREVWGLASFTSQFNVKCKTKRRLFCVFGTSFGAPQPIQF